MISQVSKQIDERQRQLEAAKIKKDWNEYFYDEYGNDLSIRDGISAFEKIIEVEIIKYTLIHKNIIQEI